MLNLINIFKQIWNKLKNTWKEIKFLISLKIVTSSVPTVLSLYSGDTITNHFDIANTLFSIFFQSLFLDWNYEEKLYSHKKFRDYLANENGSTIFPQPTDKEEVTNIVSSLNSNKASYPNSIHYYYFLKRETLKQLADLFNISFMTGLFPYVLKTSIVVLVF